MSIMGSADMIFVEGLLLCSASWGARVAAVTLDVPWFETRGADGFEALHTSTGSGGLWSWICDVWAFAHCSVAIQSKHLVWRPARRAASPTTNELHLHSQRLGTCKLRAFFCIRL